MTTGTVIWLTGLPASGKSTLAGSIAEALRLRDVPCCVLDGDAVRGALVPSPGYDDAARDAFYATLARLAALLAEQGLVVVVPATAGRRAWRKRARALAPAWVEVWITGSVTDCEAHDPKGLYEAARSGRLRGLPGVDAPFEPPTEPDVVAEGGQDARAVARVIARLSPA